MRHKTIHPEGWKPAKGYANGVLSTGTTLHIAGQIGWNAEKNFTSDEFIGQMEQALLNIRTNSEDSLLTTVPRFLSHKVGTVTRPV